MFGNTDHYFITIVQEGSLQKASQMLYVSQPSLTKYIQRLEKQLGTVLFDRSVSPMRLTDAGQLYYQYLIDVQEKENALRTQLDELSHTEWGTLRLGIPSYCGQCYLPGVIFRFQQRYPNITIDLTEGHGEAIERALLDRKIDLGILHQPIENTALFARPLFTETVLLAVPKSSEGKSMQTYSLSQFKDSVFIMPHREQKLGRIASNALSKANFTPQVFTHTENVMTMLELVSLGMGIGFIPAGGIASLPKSISEKVRFLQLRELQDIDWMLMALQRGGYRTPVFMDHFISLMARYGEERNQI